MAYKIELAIFGAFVGLATPISIYLAKKIIEPVFQLRELISKISYSITYYAPIYSNPGNTPDHHTVSSILRKHASDLKSKLYLIKYPRIFSFLGITPPKIDIEAAHSELIGVSNMLFHSRFVLQINDSIEKTKKLLRI